MLRDGTVSANVYLRRIYNFVIDLTWLPRPILPKREWPAVRFKQKRGITLDEHRLIIERELKPERKRYYELAWETGASQTDLATLRAEKIDRKARTIIFSRRKIDGRDLAPCQICFDEGSKIEELLNELPSEGFVFPYLATVRANDRSTEFWQRCQGLGITGVSLHSYLITTTEFRDHSLEGSHHPDRDAQFQHIAQRVREFQAQGQPVILVDSKKKELVGDYANKGKEWQLKGEPQEAQTHDFGKERVAPYGVYDLGRNEGWVSVGTDHDTVNKPFAACVMAAESVQQRGRIWLPWLSHCKCPDLRQQQSKPPQPNARWKPARARKTLRQMW